MKVFDCLLIGSVFDLDFEGRRRRRFCTIQSVRLNAGVALLNCPSRSRTNADCLLNRLERFNLPDSVLIKVCHPVVNTRTLLTHYKITSR